MDLPAGHFDVMGWLSWAPPLWMGTLTALAGLPGALTGWASRRTEYAPPRVQSLTRVPVVAGLALLLPQAIYGVSTFAGEPAGFSNHSLTGMFSLAVLGGLLRLVSAMVAAIGGRSHPEPAVEHS